VNPPLAAATPRVAAPVETPAAAVAPAPPPETGAGSANVAGSRPKGGTRRRLEHIDAMRPVKQIGVVSTHSLIAFAPSASLALGGSLMLLHVMREGFLFVSACMLTYSYLQLERIHLPSYGRRRLISVGLPYACWTLVYFLVTLPSQPGGFWSSIGHLGYVTATGYYQLYFLVVVLQFYVVFPWLFAWLRQHRNHHGRLLLASVAIQVLLVSAMHWGLLPPWMEGFWASREMTSYQLYLVAGMIAAFHLDRVHRWLCDHVVAVLVGAVVTALMAEAWFYGAAHYGIGWLGPSSDPFQPIVIPWNVAAIAVLYLVGVALVRPGRSPTSRRLVRRGSDDAYGVYLAQVLILLPLGWLGWKQLNSVVPWPLVVIAAVALIFVGGVLLTELLARTPLAKSLTGRSRVPLPSRSIPARWRRPLPVRPPRPQVSVRGPSGT
jgi:peptidoglycan/LPS O-acetylase OafA/YrhL